MKTTAPVSRLDNLLIQEVENEVLIYDLNKNEAFCLNETSAFIWKLCDGKNTTTQISQELKKQFKTDIDEGLIWLALDQLKKNDLIETEPEVPADYVGMSRRQVIRKVGLSTMVILPFVASVVSPTAVMAASCFALGVTGCTANGQCCSPATTCTAAPNRRCCVGPGNITNGTDAGANVVFGSIFANACPTTPNANLDTICDGARGAACCSGNAAYDGAGCNFTFLVGSRIDCDCVA